MAFGVLNWFAALSARARFVRVHCPTSTVTHPDTTATLMVKGSERPYNGQTQYMLNVQGFLAPNPGTLNGAIKYPQITGGEGYDIMAGGTQEFMFSLRPLSGLADIAARLPSTQIPRVSSSVYPGLSKPGDPATTDGASDTGSADNAGALGSFNWNGAVGLTPYLARNNAGYYTNSITVGPGESLDVIFDTSDAGCKSPGCAGPTIRWQRLLSFTAPISAICRTTSIILGGS